MCQRFMRELWLHCSKYTDGAWRSGIIFQSNEKNKGKRRRIKKFLVGISDALEVPHVKTQKYHKK